jgi:hypothetical protein
LRLSGLAIEAGLRGYAIEDARGERGGSDIGA